MQALDAALAWAAAGYPVFPVRAADRRPHVKAWPSVATVDAGTIRGWWARWPDAVAARVTGARAGDVVLDVDDLSVATGLALGDGPAYVTRRGGLHVLYRHPGWPVLTIVGGTGQLPRGLDMRGDGGYVVIYGPPPMGDTPPLPEWLAARVLDDRGPAEPGAAVGPDGAPAVPITAEHARAIIAGALADLAEAEQGGRNHALNRAAHTVASVVYALPDEAADVWHELEAVAVTIGLGDDETGRTIASGWDSGLRKPIGGRDPAVVFGTSPPVWSGPPAREQDVIRPDGTVVTVPSGDWASRMQRTSTGAIRPNEHNAALILQHDVRFAGRIVLDVFKGCVMWLDDTGEWRELTDADVLAMTIYMQQVGVPTMARGTVQGAVDHVATLRGQHPVREYLDRVTWDGVRRVDSWLADYMGAERSEYTASVGRMYLIQAVARIMQPGCKADCMMILGGPQGIYKSSTLRALAVSDQWFSDTPPAIDSDRMPQFLAGKWVVEFSELHGLSRAENSLLKRFLSTQIESYRRPYARITSHEPRQCVIVGTTNDDSYLTDASGARRYWPVKVCRGDVEAITTIRDQLWAEAVALYRAGVPWWPDARFAALQEVVAEDVTEVDPWQDLIRDYLDTDDAGRGQRARVKVHDLSRVLGIPSGQVHRGTVARIVSVLMTLGWDRRKIRGSIYYVRPGHALT